MDQIIAFLSTPAGQSMINKMPLLMQRAQELTMAELNKTMPAAQRQLREDIDAIGIFPSRNLVGRNKHSALRRKTGACPDPIYC